MKYYKDENNQVYAFEADGSQDAYIPSGLVPISEAEADALRYPEPSLEEQASTIRQQRDDLLLATDYLMMPDYQLDDEKRNDFKDYRQALRDITKQTSFPESVEWPDKPTMEKNMINR